MAEAANMSELPIRALSLRQPWAELVMRGDKTIEARSRTTKKREVVQIYASMGRLPKAEERELGEKYELDIEALPRGVLVGTVEIVGCRLLTKADSKAACFLVEDEHLTLNAWLLKNHHRFESPRAPENKAQPSFFFPFGNPASNKRPGL